jgi:hypothetical protein
MGSPLTAYTHRRQSGCERVLLSTQPNITWHKFFKYAQDIKIWLFAYIFLGCTLGGYQIAFFLPAILASMGFNNMEIQLLVCPCTCGPWSPPWSARA